MEFGDAVWDGARVDGVGFIVPDGEGGVALAVYGAVVRVGLAFDVFAAGAGEAGD